MSIEPAMLTISSSVAPFSSCLQSFPASGSFLMSQFFASGGQRIGTSAFTVPLPPCRLEAGCTGTVPHWTLRYLPELHKRKGCGQKPKEFSFYKKNQPSGTLSYECGRVAKRSSHPTGSWEPCGFCLAPICQVRLVCIWQWRYWKGHQNFRCGYWPQGAQKMPLSMESCEIPQRLPEISLWSFGIKRNWVAG